MRPPDKGRMRIQRSMMALYIHIICCGRRPLWLPCTARQSLPSSGISLGDHFATEVSYPASIPDISSLRRVSPAYHTHQISNFVLPIKYYSRHLLRLKAETLSSHQPAALNRDLITRSRRTSSCMPLVGMQISLA